MMKYLVVTIFLTPTFGQYMPDMDMKPDVTFGEHNDRFDITSIVQQQNRLYDQSETRDLEDFRRNGIDINELAAALREDVRNNKDFKEFAYHDRMESDENDESYEENLSKFKNTRRVQKLVGYLHGNYDGSRRSDSLRRHPEDEVLFHYAVPLDMKINGYLQVPLID